MSWCNYPHVFSVYCRYTIWEIPVVPEFFGFLKSGLNLRKKDKKHELIVDLLQHRKEEKNKLVKGVEKMTDMEEKHSKENENYLFFKSMAAIVNKLDKKNQAIARSKVFRVVSDLELAKYTAPSSVSTTPSGSSLASWTPAPASFECDQFRDSTSKQYVWMGDG
ncbi:hypothetical protein J6590_004981 [Homalodisca vitripennis]|nr:hypothetical protein J6590_004981 [Homalodisca vitripennis]